MIPDAISRLDTVNDVTQNPEEHIDALHASLRATAGETRLESPIGYAFNAMLVEMSPEVKVRILDGYRSEHQWTRTIEQIERNPKLGENAASLPHILEEDLLYVIGHDGKRRLCILKSINREVLHLAQD